MASIFGHGLVAYTTAKVIDSKSSKRLLVLAIISAIIPDLDVVTFSLGIDYMHPLGHRGFTHSIVFALLWSLLLSACCGKQRKWLFFVVLFLATLSHGVLDAMTTGGKGVGFFIPFDNSRHFFEMRLIKVSPIGVERFFSEWGLQVILSELKYVFVPCALVLIALRLKNARNKSENL